MTNPTTRQFENDLPPCKACGKEGGVIAYDIVDGGRYAEPYMESVEYTCPECCKKAKEAKEAEGEDDYHRP